MKIIIKIFIFVELIVISIIGCTATMQSANTLKKNTEETTFGYYIPSNFTFQGDFLVSEVYKFTTHFTFDYV